MAKKPLLQAKITKRGILMATVITVIAIGVPLLAGFITRPPSLIWSKDAQVEYSFSVNYTDTSTTFYSNSTNATDYTFTVTYANYSAGIVNASWNARPYGERFYLVYRNLSTLANYTSGMPATGTSNIEGKTVTWLNKTDILGSIALNTTYMKSFIKPGHHYYYLIDNNTGMVVQIGDMNNGQTVMKLAEWPDQYIFNWKYFFAGLVLVGGVILFFSLFSYGTRELKVAPHDRLQDRANNYLSAFLFAGILTAVIIFIGTIVLQAISINWLYGLNSSVTISKSTPKALGSNWQVDSALLQALEWPTLIPVLIVIIGVFASIYPFFDFLHLPKRGADKPMEIHQALDSHVTGRIKFRLNYFFVAGILAVVYILPTYVIYDFLAPKLLMTQSDPTIVPILVIISWFAVPALMFLNYYASIGVSSMFWTGYTKGFKAKDKVENTFNSIIFIIAVILVISATYNFVNVFVEMATGKLTSIISLNPSGGSRFFTTLVEFFITYNFLDFQRPKDLWNFQQFFSVIPFDLLLFFISVCAVGLYGFYSKFLSKEPLNRPVLMTFACYIVAAVGLEVFVNVILRLPNAFANSVFAPIFTNQGNLPYGSTAYNDAYFSSFDTIRLLFFIPYLADKTFMFIFLVYNLLINKRLRENVRERILAIAVQRERIDILSKFTASKDLRTQRIVLENVLRIVKKNPNESGKIAKMVKGVIISEDQTLNALANKVFYFLSTVLPIQDLEPAVLAAITSGPAFVRDAIGENLVKIGKDDPAKLTRLYADIVTSELPDATLEFLAVTLEQLRVIRPDAPSIVLTPFLDLGSDTPRGGGLKILKLFNILNLRDKRGDLIPKLTRIITDKSESQAQDAIELLGTLGASDPDKMSEILARLEELHEKASAPVKKRIIRAEVSFMIAAPDRAGEIFPKLFAFLGDISPEVRGEVNSGLGQMSTIFKKGENFLSIRKIITKQLKDFDEDVRAGGVKALAEVGKANPKLLKEPEFREMLETIINESSDVVRETAVDLFTQFSKAAPSMDIFLLPLRILEDPQDSAKKAHPTALRILNKVIGTFPKDAGIDLVLNPILAYDRKDGKNRVEIAGILQGVARTRPETSERIYPVLQELAKDANEVVAGFAIKGLTEIALAKIANPGLQFSVSVDVLVDNLLGQCKDRRAEALNAAIQSGIKLYGANKTFHSKVYPVFMELVRTSQQTILPQVVPVLTSIVCENKTDYAGKKVAKELLPALLEVMKKAPEEIKNILTAAVDTIVASFSETAKEVSLVLITAANLEKTKEARIMAISALGKFPGATEEPDISFAMVTNTSIIRSRQFRHAAMEAIRDLIAALPPRDKLSSNQKRCLEILTRPMLRWNGFFYIRDIEIEVRKAYAEVLATIGTNQQHFAKKALPLLSILAKDMDASVSLYAAQEFFNIMRQHPETMDVAVHEFPTIVYSPHDATRKLLFDEILALLGKGGKLAQVMPPLIVLAGDENKTIRRNASQEFQAMVNKNPAETAFFTKNLLILARDPHAQMREGAAREITTFVSNHPSEKKTLDVLLQAFLGLARDPVKSVRTAVALRLPEVAKITSPDQVNVIFQTLFRLIREDERTTKNSVVEGFRIITSKYPERNPEVIPDLKQVNAKENLAALDDLIKEITGKEMVQPEDVIKSIIDKVQTWWKSRGKKKTPKASKKPVEGPETPAVKPAKPAEGPKKTPETPAKPVEGPAKPVEPPAKSVEGPSKPADIPPKAGWTTAKPASDASKKEEPKKDEKQGK